jgi:hypothetical protein
MTRGAIFYLCGDDGYMNFALSLLPLPVTPPVVGSST